MLGFGAIRRRQAAAPVARRGSTQPASRRPAPLHRQEFTVNAVGKDDKLDMALKTAYAANKYNVVATLAQSGKVWQAAVQIGRDRRCCCCCTNFWTTRGSQLQPPAGGAAWLQAGERGAAFGWNSLQAAAAT